MSGGDIAGLIAAGVFAILVALLALPIIRLTKVFDELIVTIRSLNQSTSPLIDEVTKTVVTTNEQLEKVDGITSNVSDASANVSALSSLVTSTVGQPLIKVALMCSTYLFLVPANVYFQAVSGTGNTRTALVLECWLQLIY